MNLSEIGDPQVHDLLRIDTDCLTAGCIAQPSWVRESLITCPWAVVRRAQAPVGQLAVGVRGGTRSERWGGFCEASSIRKIVSPEKLLFIGHASNLIPRTPALRALPEMCGRWADLKSPWGPTGSVGFELATGRPVTTETSDLDLLIRAPQRIALEEARVLFNCTRGLETRVDVRVETPMCEFSLQEYVAAAYAQILLRHFDGVRLGDDPWFGVEGPQVRRVES
jgi:phosphoribosyl-dephospho-CoA transferase